MWEASDRICGKRLKAALPHLVESMERHGHLDLDLDPEVREHLLTASAATLDRLLKPVRATVASRRKRRRNLSAGRNIPVRTFADWNRPPPGFLEIDLETISKQSFKFVVAGGDDFLMPSTPILTFPPSRGKGLLR